MRYHVIIDYNIHYDFSSYLKQQKIDCAYIPITAKGIDYLINCEEWEMTMLKIRFLSLEIVSKFPSEISKSELDF